MREWTDIQADLFAMAEEADPGATERQIKFEEAKKRVAELRTAEADGH